MQHVFEFYLKPIGEDPIQSQLITESSRSNKVGRQVLKKLNEWRAVCGFDPLNETNIELLKVRKLR